MTHDRRGAARRLVGDDEPLYHARLRTGAELRVVDASTWGILAETTERLLPGRHLDVHIISTDGRVLVRSLVARAFVWQLEADRVQYRAAFAFERAIGIRAAGYAMPAPFLAAEIERGSTYPDHTVSADIEFSERLSA